MRTSTVSRRHATTRTSGKVLASVALVAAAAGVAGLGTYGSFTSTTSASAAVSAGKVKIDLSAPGFGVVGADNRLSVTVDGLVPGDTYEGPVTVTNSGTEDLGSLTLTTVATTSSRLDTDPTDGLQLSLDSCSQAWAPVAVGKGYAWNCPGTTQTVLASRPVIGANLALANLTALTHGRSDNLRARFTFPASADNRFQGLKSVIAFDLTGTQRGATSR